MVQALTIAVAYVIPGVTVRPMETVAISVVTDAVVHLETPVLPTIPPSIHVAVATLLALATIRRARLAAPLPALVIVEVAITLPALAPVRRAEVPILLPALAPVRRVQVPIALLALAITIVAVVALLPVLTIVGPAATMLAIVTQSICKATLISLDKM